MNESAFSDPITIAEITGFHSDLYNNLNSHNHVNFDKAKLKHKDKFSLEEAEYIAESSWSKNNKSSDWFRIETVSTSDSREKFYLLTEYLKKRIWRQNGL